MNNGKYDGMNDDMNKEKYDGAGAGTGEYTDMNNAHGDDGNTHIQNENQSSRAFSIVSLVTGIISIVFCTGGLILGILAVVFSHLSKKRLGFTDDMAKAGKICGIVGISLFSAIVLFYVFVFVLALFGAAVSSYYVGYGAALYCLM